jgi:hypothetical protein
VDSLEFKIVGWLERHQGSDEERATFAELEIRAGGVCLTEVFDHGAKTVRTAVRVSLFHLLDWLLWNHWRLLYEPSGAKDTEWALSHRLASAGGGFLWPDLTMSSDGLHLHLVQRCSEASPTRMVRYLNEANVWVPLLEAERAMDQLAEQVIARLTALDFRDTHLQGLYDILREERGEPKTVAFRRLEATLGLDPDEVEAANVLKLRADAAWIGEHARDEVFAQARFQGSAATIKWLREQSQAPEHQLNLSDLECIASSGLGGASRPPWKRGAELAQRAREKLGLDDLEPLDLESLTHTKLIRGAARPQRSMGAGFLGAGGLASVGGAFRRHSATGLRFEVARVVGDALIRYSDDQVLPITERDTARQKIQRSFAQELLAPVAGLKQLVCSDPSDEELDEAAAHFDVSPWAVRTALVNAQYFDRGYLPRNVV